MAYTFLDQVIGVDAPTVTGTDRLWHLGQEAAAADSALGMAKFVYVKGSNAGQGALCAYGGFTASVMSAALSDSHLPLGIAAGNLSSTNRYGWVQVEGIVSNAWGTNHDIAAGKPLYLHAVAGKMGSAVVTGNFIAGAYAHVSGSSDSNAASSLSVQIRYPYVPGSTSGF